MKRTKLVIAVALIGIMCAGAASAYGCAGGWDRGPRGRGPGGFGGPGPQERQRNSDRPRQAEEAVTVNGKLQVVNGKIAVVQDKKTYYAAGIQRLVGFIDGLKEGATVTLEGGAVSLPRDTDSYVLRVSKLTLNGKVYDNLTPQPPQDFQQDGPPPRR